LGFPEEDIEVESAGLGLESEQTTSKQDRDCGVGRTRGWGGVGCLTCSDALFAAIN